MVAVVRKNRLIVNRVSYFRAHAEDVVIGSIGRKRTPIGKRNYLDVEDRIPPRRIDVIQGAELDIDFSRTSKGDFNTSIDAIIKGVPVKLSGGVAFDRMRSGELKLVKLSVLNNRMMQAANNSPQKLRSLIDWGNSARIVHQIFVVMEASLSNQLSTSSNLSISGGQDDIQASLDGTGSTSVKTTISISKGTCFAYLMARIEWDARQKRNRTRIVGLRNEQVGIG
ncbi:hypothetical protein [Nodosilinea sp. P-1105]|uniref:hypothetical protein n=1 Tax=Nodosilinea sp. P-1105 TaxID=2546229 RepID=UPI00146BE117|nr:hypothetical protein [Nodosilinea sp. P-1105]NMF83321.1 hypothetical protein [Nodosilinea sp. P-1105]